MKSDRELSVQQDGTESSDFFFFEMFFLKFFGKKKSVGLPLQIRIGNKLYTNSVRKVPKIFFWLTPGMIYCRKHEPGFISQNLFCGPSVVVATINDLKTAFHLKPPRCV